MGANQSHWTLTCRRFVMLRLLLWGAELSRSDLRSWGRRIASRCSRRPSTSAEEAFAPLVPALRGPCRPLFASVFCSRSHQKQPPEEDRRQKKKRKGKRPPRRAARGSRQHFFVGKIETSSKETQQFYLGGFELPGGDLGSL